MTASFSSKRENPKPANKTEKRKKKRTENTKTKKNIMTQSEKK